MRLYKTELYKLCHRKIFLIGVICIPSVLLLLFCQHIASERSTINGKEYHGYEAIKADRQITEEYKGVLTDEKLQQIAAKYGFPQKVEKYYGLTDGNFLNSFVMTYASDGYFYDWEDYRIATKTLCIDDTALGELRTMSGQDIWFAYYAGWSTCLESYTLAMIMVSILIICIVSTVFSNEEQSGTKPLLFTTKEGPAKDTHAKIAAAFTLSVTLWTVITLFSLLMYGMTYGLDGLYCLAALVLGWGEPMIPFGTLLLESTLLSLLGILELTAATLCISARCRCTFHSVSAAVLGWIMPILAFMILSGVYQILSSSSLPYSVLRVWAWILFVVHLLIYSSPFYLTYSHAIISELSALSFNTGFEAYFIVPAFAVIIAILCVVGGWRRYRKHSVK
ncbi:MAG: hypothetical protein K2J99_07555 [Lachnospiraceae bacterium]|nr:hypothetical protein [Lachnospiraceae bacterium]